MVTHKVEWLGAALALLFHNADGRAFVSTTISIGVRRDIECSSVAELLRFRRICHLMCSTAVERLGILLLPSKD